MLDWSQCPAVERVGGKVSGEWLFKDTRVPVRALFENLEDGARVDDFLEWFPGVTREQVELCCGTRRWAGRNLTKSGNFCLMNRHEHRR
jgi:uncharacterized protein (DUF433 family)